MSGFVKLIVDLDINIQVNVATFLSDDGDGDDNDCMITVLLLSNMPSSMSKKILQLKNLTNVKI